MSLSTLERVWTPESQVTNLVTDLAARVNPAGRGLARVLFKLYSGQNIVITAAGDSILEGTTASQPGTNDALSLLKTGIQTTWGVTATMHNRAVSGQTVASWMLTYWATALADQADLYVIGLGTNDLAYDTLSPNATRLQGVQRDASIAHLEHRLRELRAKQPTADILVISSNPYWAAGASSNVFKAQWRRDLARLADAYDCGFADVYAAFTALGSGNWDSYLSDGVHPNDAGHALTANTMLAQLPSTWAPATPVTQGTPLNPSPLPRTPYLYAPRAVSQRGLQTMAAAAATNYAAKLGKFGSAGGLGAGSWSGSGPWTSTTAGDSIFATFPGCDAYLSLVLGAGQGVVDLYVDGLKAWAAVDLSTMTNGKLLTLHGLGLGWHTVTITVVSGTVTVTSITYLATRCEWVNYDRGTVTAAGLGANQAGLAMLPGANGVTTVTAGTLTVPFVGTGLNMLAFRSAVLAGNDITSITIDGGAVTATQYPNLIGYGAVPIASGLTYGKHTAVVTFARAGSFPAGFSIFDEAAHLRPGHQEGWSKQGDTVRLSGLFPTAPVVTGRGVSSSTSALITASSVATDSFVMGGPSGESGWWQTDAPDLSAGNLAGY